MLVGNCVATLTGDVLETSSADVAARIAFLLGLVWSLTGQLAVSLLVLRPGITVGQALRTATNRLPWLLAPLLLLSLAFVLLAMPVVTVIAASGYVPAKPDTLANVPGWAGVYIMVGLGVTIWAAVRLAMVLPMIADTGAKPVEALRRAFVLTRGLALRLFALLILYLFVAILLTGAARFVVGALAALIGAALGSPFTGAVLVALGSGVVETALTLTATVFLAQLYRRVSNGT